MNVKSKESISKAMFVNDAAYNKQLTKKSTYYANIIIWTVIFLYPLLGILDYIYSYPIYQPLLLTKIIIVMLIYAVYDISRRSGRSPSIALHTAFFLISLNAAIICNIVPFEVAPVFFLMFASLFMLFNLTVFWPPVNSFGHLFIALALISMGYHLFNTVTVETYISQGAGIFVMTGFFSCFIPVARYGIIRKDTLNDLRVKNTTAQLYILHDNLIEKNREVEVSNSRLTGLIMQQDSFMALVRADILHFVRSINQSADRIRTAQQGLDFQAAIHIDQIKENILRLEQLAEIFPDEHASLSSDIVLDMVEINLSSSVKSIADCMGSQFEHFNINFSLSVPETPPIVILDKLYIDQVLFNLFANCLKSSETRNRIDCSFKNKGNRLHLVVRCTPGEYAGNDVSEDWESAAPTVQSLQKGLGPGFYLAKLLVKKMNGEIVYHKGINHVTYVMTFMR